MLRGRGAEDLAADIGAEDTRNEDGDWSAPFALARHLTLFAAAAAGVPAHYAIDKEGGNLGYPKDTSPDAYAKLVDKLLATPQYGEHWARQWLDLARYADSKGYADDQPRTIWR